MDRKILPVLATLGRAARAAALIVALLAAVVAPTPPAEAAPEAVVTDVRLGVHDGHTRFVLELTKRVPFTVFTLDGPSRVVVDLPEVGWRLPPQPLPGNVGIIHRLRYGLHRPGTTRIVLDCADPAAVRDAFVMELAGESVVRLVIDLARRDGTPLPPPPAVAQAEPAPRAEARARTPAPTPKPNRVPRRRIIVLDPGHGGRDPGAIGAGQVYEKHIALAAAREVRAALERLGRYKVVLTRDRDIFIRLRDRVEIARAADADLFLSIHADAIADHAIRGASVYTLSENASDSVAAELAERENKADLIAGIDLSTETPEVTNILIDLAQRESMNESAKFAAILAATLGKETRLLRNTHRFAGFAVLKSPDVPSGLVELGFLSNRRDAKALREAAYRRRLASAIARAIDGYFVGVEEARTR